MKLTDLKIKGFKPTDKMKQHADGGGLLLEVYPNGSKLWRLRYRFNGKAQKISLGKYPTVSLAEARAERELLKAQLANGKNPSIQRQLEAAANTHDKQNTFGALAAEWLEIKTPSWEPSTLKKNSGQLKNHLLPHLGHRPVLEITTPELLAVLRRVESQGKTDTTQQVKTIAKSVLGFAIATGRAERNVAADLTNDTLKPKKGGHHAAITDPGELAKLLNDIDSYTGSIVVCLALKLAPLVFLRPGELRKAEWSELDLDNALWTIPAERMKGRKGKKQKHLVPLSRQALAILHQLKPVTGRQAYVFPGQGRGATISDNTLNKAMRRMGYTSEQVTAHGFRATARTILDETLEQPPEVIEAQLAHSVKDANGRAYNRTQYLEKRRELMQTWADYLDVLKAQARGENVTPIRQREAI